MILGPCVLNMPIAIKKMSEQDIIDAVITIGVVIEGSTKHDEIVVQLA